MKSPPESRSAIEPDFRALFEAIPAPCLILAPDFNIVAANAAFLRTTRTSLQEISGRNIFDLYPDNPHAPATAATTNLRVSLQRVLQEKAVDIMPVQRFDTMAEKDGRMVLEERYWSPINAPVFDASGKLTHIMHCAEDVTEFAWTKMRIAGTSTRAFAQEGQYPPRVGDAGGSMDALDHQVAERTRGLLQEREYVYSLLMASPVPSTVTLGAEHRYWLQNKAHYELTGRSDIIGKRFQDAFPEFADWALPILDEVYQHGQPHHIDRKKVLFNKHNTAGEDEAYFTLSWHPFFGADGKVEGVITTATDITELVRTENKLRQSEEFYRIAADAAQIGAWDVYLEQQEAILSPRMANMMGLVPDRQRFSFAELLEVTDLEDREKVIHAMRHAWNYGGIYEEKMRFRLPNGEMRTLYSRAKVIYGDDGKPAFLRGATIDLTEQLRIEEELRIANDMLGLAVEGVGEGIWEWDIRTRTVHYSARAKATLGYAPEDSPTYRLLWPTRVHPDDRARVCTALREHFDGKVPSYICEYRARCKSGAYKWVLSRGIVVARDANGKALRMTGMFSDISERKEADEHIWRLANFDVLTGLPNRRLFRDRLEHDVNQAYRKRHELALLFIDLDRFKQVNDSLGHQFGDQLLRLAAQRIQKCVRETDTVARLGGDEFTVILNEIDHKREKVEVICDKILRALAEPFNLGAEPTSVSASIGIALYPADAKTHDELMRKVDQAMYYAKHAGKNRYAYFTRDMDERAHQRHRVTNELRRAMHEGHFEVYYQPVVEIATGRIIKAEALIRWNHPELGFIEPSEFIPLAEEAGLIGDIGDWVFREAVYCSQHWAKLTNAPFQIAVNKSPMQFGLKQKDAWIEFLRRQDIDPKCIVVEITEGLLMHTSSQVMQQLHEYKAAGMQMAIDDFGTGYSSMAYLKRFDIDYLKIDKSFVRDINTDAANKTITESIIAMAHKLGIKVIAEGVERQEQLQILIDAGCDYAQGYLFSRPQPVNRFEQILARGVAAAALNAH